MYSATVPLPDEVDEMALAGFIRRRPVELVRALTSELLVPARAEMVIEGYLDPGETVRGGAFGNHTGYYTPGADVPLLRVTAITRRRLCIYPATVVGPPPMEDCYLAKATERLLLPLLRRDLPEIVDINLPMEGIFHGCALVSAAKAFAGHGRQLISRLWSAGWLRQARLLVVVDNDVNVQDLSRSAWRVINNVDWSRDLLCPPDAPAAGRPFGGRLGIDATRKLPDELGGVEPPPELAMSETVRKAVQKRWRQYGF
jgi:4-hydroxy-3-polyprenylbenzoate decarboxylase